MKNVLNHALQTTTLPNPETQARTRQVKLVVDWHAAISGRSGCKPERTRREMLTSGNRKVAREIAEQSFVLLKNDGQILPLKKSRVIALVGPLADDQIDLLGCWRGGGSSSQVKSAPVQWNRQAVSIQTK